ncbi:MAG: pyridoxine 5'-phosphate synthase [Gammaproteobacteria bacterium]|nr:pyridoxine 5'-phosphate synthase [Gammaproteobacteria bacterium]
MTKLSVNLNKVALVRNSGDTTKPIVVDAAITCL